MRHKVDCCVHGMVRSMCSECGADTAAVGNRGLPSCRVRAFLRNIEEAAPLDSPPVDLSAVDVAGLLAERDTLFEQLQNAIGPVWAGAVQATEKLHVEIERRFTRAQVVRAMELAASPDTTWDTMAEREVVFAEILEAVRQ